MVVADEASQRAMEAPDMSKKEGIVAMPTVVPDLPEVRGVEAAPGTGKENPRWNVRTVARKATWRVAPIAGNKEIDTNHTTLRVLNRPKVERARPS